MKSEDFSRAPFPKYITFSQIVCAGDQNLTLKLAFPLMAYVTFQHKIPSAIKERSG